MSSGDETSYHRLLNADDGEIDKPDRGSRSRWMINLFHASSWVVALAFFALAIAITAANLTPSERQCIAQSTVWSPLLPIIEYNDIDFDNAFNSTSIYRGPPTPEREEAWERLVYKNFIEIPESKIDLYNRSPQVKSSLKRVPGEGRGYTALVEAFHQLHCLNVVRQYTWFQAGKYHDKIPVDMRGSEIGNRMHVDHCIETVRIALMCYADVTPLFVREDPHSPTGDRADFESHHRCRNFDKIEEWVDNNWAVEVNKSQ